MSITVKWSGLMVQSKVEVPPIFAGKSIRINSSTVKYNDFKTDGVQQVLNF